ncbi:MAG: histidine phosphatase family protein, partial [Pseudomonadota bacterium]
SLGERQATALISPLSALGITHIVSSPMHRAIGSIQPLARASGLNIGLDDDLRERDTGERPSHLWSTDMERLLAHPDHAEYGGESANDVILRGHAAVDRAKQAGPVPLIVSHGQWISLMLGQFGRGVTSEEWRTMPRPALFRVKGAAWAPVPLDLSINALS